MFSPLLGKLLIKLQLSQFEITINAEGKNESILVYISPMAASFQVRSLKGTVERARFSELFTIP